MNGSIVQTVSALSTATSSTCQITCKSVNVKLCEYLNPRVVPSFSQILFLADESPLERNGTFQLVPELHVGRDQERFGGAALPDLLVGP